MNSVIGALRVTLGLDSAAFDTGADAARKKATALGAGLKTAIVAAAAAAAAAVGALAIAVKGSLNEADDMSKSAAKLGVPIEELSQLKYAADLSGVSMDGLSTAFKKLSTNMAEAQNGSKSATDIFKQIGASATDSDGKLKASGAVLMELADRFSAIPDGAAKSAMAVKLFGRAGLDLIPLLNGGSAALREMMAEADALGLTLSAETGKAAEQFNDNLSRLGYAASGLVTQLTAVLAPALSVISDALVVAARGLLTLIQYLPTVAEYVAVAGGALLVAFGPTVLAGIGAITVAIGTALVGAIVAMGVAIAANPLGALAIGIAAAIVAIYAFRDDIKQAIGVDVIGIVKSAANMVINSFRAAFEDIKMVWAQFPNVIGAAVVGAVNAVVGAVQAMISKAVGLLNTFIATANTGLSKIGLDIPEIPPPKFSDKLLPNDYAEKLKTAVADRNKVVADIMASDPIGAMGAAFQTATAPAQNFAGALSGVNDELAALGGGGGKKAKGGKSETDRYSDIVDGANRRIASLKAEQQSIGMTEEASAALRYETDLLNRAQQSGINLTDAQTQTLSGLARSMAGIEAATDRMREALDFAKDATQGFLSDFRQGLQNGEGIWKSFGNAALNVLNKIVDKIETQLVDALFSMNGALGGIGGGAGGGGGGGLLGGLFSGLGRLFGFASGGSFQVGGAGGIDSQLVAFKASPNETVSVTKPGQERGGASSVHVTVGVSADNNGNLRPFVESVSQSTVARAAPAIIGRANSQVVPTMARFQNDKAGGEWR